MPEGTDSDSGPSTGPSMATFELQCPITRNHYGVVGEFQGEKPGSKEGIMEEVASEPGPSRMRSNFSGL